MKARRIAQIERYRARESYSYRMIMCELMSFFARNLHNEPDMLSLTFSTWGGNPER